jgi:hypothetical protein
MPTNPLKSVDYKGRFKSMGWNEFDLLAAKRLWAAAFRLRLQPYESVIWDIETLHFTSPEHPSSISFLGTT